MTGREDFERRLEASVRTFVETAPTDVDAARLTHALATNAPRMRRLVPRLALRWPDLRPAWVMVAAVLLMASLAGGLLAPGGIRHLLQGPGPLTPPLTTSPAVSAPPATASPSPTVQPSPSARPSASGQPLTVVITSWMVISDANTGTFNASGPAAAAGLICPRGTVIDLAAVSSADIARGDYTVPKEFTCDDGSGTFVIEMSVHVEDAQGTESLAWRILRGTGSYGRLQGDGDGVTMGASESQVINTLTGSIGD